ncbi:hypothetical protein MID07_04985 [Acinetobacter seifertii]|uniref:hypothetical protein n=1 Tax=Acinetobacter seifertii TaxID=1530123 RepID=UPI001F011C60|nr:hypothetical protein [Acinetobacter seifertii]MCG8283981.1 hypothetical protein [Acinetobacter seifertii]
MFQIIELILQSNNLPEKFTIITAIIGFTVVTLSYIKQQELFKDGLSLYSKYINRKINRIKAYISAGNLSPEQLIRFQHRIEILTLQGLLKLKIYNLDFLNFFNGYEDAIRARMLYLNAYDFVQFNEETKAIELKKPIDEDCAEQLSKIGEFLFFLNGVIAYIIFVIPVVFFPQYLSPNNVFWILAIIFPVMLTQIYLGSKLMKYMKRRKYALELIKLKRITSIQINN